MPGKRRRLAQARRAMGFSQEGFARRLGVDRSTVARWEAGETEPQPWVRSRIAELLEVALRDVGDLLATEEVIVNRRDFAAAGALAALGFGIATHRAGPFDPGGHGMAAVSLDADGATALADVWAHEAGDLARAVPLLARLGDDFGGVDELGHLAVALAEHGDRMLQTDEVARNASPGLVATVGELWMQAAWLRYDAGDQNSSYAYFSRALHLGQLVDNLDLEVRALAGLSSHATYNRRFLDGVLCARRARRIAGDGASARVLSLLFQREAVAYAAQGDARAADEAMARAGEAYTDRAPGEPRWISFYTPAERLAFDGLTNAMLGRADRAETQLVSALEQMTCQRRNQVYYATVLAQARVARRDSAGAYEALESVLPTLVQTGSRRAKERAEAICLHAMKAPSARSRAFLGAARDAGLTMHRG
jgi:transcriptional regulator with XRE-family HTH domain